VTSKYTAACVTFMIAALLATSYITLGDGDPSKYVPPLMYAVLLLASLAVASLIISYIVLRNAWKEVFSLK